ncbi:MAG: hypothetical protein ACREOO_10065 [bacterium]
MKISKLNRLFAGALILAHVMFMSCDKNPSKPDQKAPVLPPASSLNLDLNAFKSAGNLAKSNGDQSAVGLNFITAYSVVTIINASVTLMLSVPAYVFAAAISQQPVLDPKDGKFHWVYTVTDTSGTALQADLAGWIDQDGLESRWEMRITASRNNPPLNDFLWIAGRAALDNSSGYWDIYDAEKPATSAQALHVDWQVPSAAQATLRFTAVDPASPDNGDQLTYRAEGNLRGVTYFDKSDQETVEISWDEVTHAGYLIAPGYNNGQKSCWDELLNDVTCR